MLKLEIDVLSVSNGQLVTIGPWDQTCRLWANCPNRISSGL